MELTTFTFSVQMPAIFTCVFDVMIAWICIGSMVLMPWLIYRAEKRNTYYWELTKFSIKGFFLFLVAIILWPYLAWMLVKALYEAQH